MVESEGVYEIVDIVAIPRVCCHPPAPCPGRTRPAPSCQITTYSEKSCTSYTAPRISSLSINPRKNFQGELLYWDIESLEESTRSTKKETPWIFIMIYPAILNLVLFPIMVMTSSWRLEWSGCAAAKRWRGGLISWDNGMAKHKLMK